MSNNLICFGDVVKLAAKSAFVDSTGDANGNAFLGFLEHKKEMLLVVAPVKPELHAKFSEAEFIVAPVRGDKQPVHGTPLNYKQPFVLKTSDGSGYALNNKTPNTSEVVSLRESGAHGIKGEMYVAIEKEGFGPETHVHDGDADVELHVVDSNRIRKTYNNVPLKHFQKSKADAPGGHVTCSNKGQVLQFKLVKLADKTETRKFIKDPVFRRASQLLVDAKADETSEASVLESPSRAGSIVTVGPLGLDDPTASTSVPSSPTVATASTAVAVATEEPKKAETPETEAVQPQPQVTVTVEATPVVTKTPVVATITPASTTTTSVESTPPVTTTSEVDATEVAAKLEHVVVIEDAKPIKTVETDKTVKTTPVKELVKVTTPKTVPASTVGAQLQSTLATIELSAASVSETDTLNGSVPVHTKLSARDVPASATASEPSEVDTLSGLPIVHEDQVETACAGKCAIM